MLCTHSASKMAWLRIARHGKAARVRQPWCATVGEIVETAMRAATAAAVFMLWHFFPAGKVALRQPVRSVKQLTLATGTCCS